MHNARRLIDDATTLAPYSGAQRAFAPLYDPTYGAGTHIPYMKGNMGVLDHMGAISARAR